ncbi:protein-arginine deiminase family protein [candidate division CSSED10-310 bacterium]|uniref:Protein-arginine deiminase family protein n=1 Tax=candidate division CSSED10-310 bacterium TaxID=2855610 RepID=A0ABV6Z4N4_UNCC1
MKSEKSDFSFSSPPAFLFLVLFIIGSLIMLSCSDEDSSDEGSMVDIRADVNRNGTVDLSDPTEDAAEDSWDANHGAIFLANIDDDQNSCPKTGSDEELAQCNDAADEVINGEKDLLDLARLKTIPWPDAADDAHGQISVSEPGSYYIRLFKKAGSTFSVFHPTTALSATEVRNGVEFAIEATDFVRDQAVWDGFIDITYAVAFGENQATVDNIDTVRLRVSPLIFHHHLNKVKTAYVTALRREASQVFRSDLQDALTAAEVAEPLYEFQGVADQWTQDFLETAYMAMPAVAGQHIIHVNFRSANYSRGKLRSAGKVVFTELRGPDVAGAVCYDPEHNDDMDTLNSFGNLEVIPPFSNGTEHWPLGRIVRGSAATYYPDTVFETMLQSQQVQLPVSIDTSWLIVSHIDETISYLKADSPRGWILLANDAALARSMLQDQEDNGYGQVKMFVGKYWMTGIPAEISISEVLADPDLMDANAWAAVKVDEMVSSMQTLTGISDSEIVPIPFLHVEVYGYSLAYQPGTTNSMVISGNHFGAPTPHGPEINGQDIFRQQLTSVLAEYGVTTHYIENWDLYHALWGEVHCGSQVTREIANDNKWWESGL